MHLHSEFFLKSLFKSNKNAFNSFWNSVMQCFGLAHLSLFEVVKDVLCILRTHVTVLGVLRVNVKLLWDLKKEKARGTDFFPKKKELSESQKLFWKCITPPTCCLWRCAGTSQAAVDVGATSSSTGAATSVGAASSQGLSSTASVFSFSAVVPSELTEEDLQKKDSWELQTFATNGIRTGKTAGNTIKKKIKIKVIK